MRYPLYEYHLERFFGTSIVIAAERQEARQDGEFPSSGDIVVYRPLRSDNRRDPQSFPLLSIVFVFMASEIPL
jgi:hypothetical protein